MASIVWNRSCRALLSLCLLLPLLVAGQEPSDRLVITGQVIDMRTGLPLPAANVMIGALETGSASDDSGYYRIDIPISSHQGEQVDLTVRYIGYHTVTYPIMLNSGISALDFLMAPTILSLEETVVSAPRSTISSGSPSQIFSGEELRKTGSLKWEHALAGRIPGFQMPSSTSNLGGAPVFSFRGEQDNFRRDGTRPSVLDYPILVVDGIAFSNQINPDGTVSGPTLHIGLSEIEYIEVVRGPGAVWRYGSRAAKGAIIITTKSGVGKY